MLGGFMSLSKCYWIIPLYFTALTHTLLSQIVLQGVVTDNGTDPVQNALVEVIDQADTTLKYSDTTDDQGHYIIQIPGTVVDDANFQTPVAFRLLQNYPNPFNPSTVIEYELGEPAHVTVEIHNILGQKIKTLFSGFQSQSAGRVIWDATDDLGNGVSGGVYIYSLTAGGLTINKKMLLLDGQQGKIAATLFQSERAAECNQTELHKKLSEQYLLRITGNDILTYEKLDLEINKDLVLDVQVVRTGTLTDIDGNVYRTVKIGTQWWMAENLKVTKYRNGDAIANVTDKKEWTKLEAGAYCNYDNNEANVDTYGRLYNWFAVNDSRSIAPAGWHVPGDEEWDILVNFLKSRVGGKMKTTGTVEAGTGLWYSPNEGATNESGFSAVPSGCRHTDGNYYYIGIYADIWSSMELNSDYACNRELYNLGPDVYRLYNSKQVGFSVRLIKD